MSERTLARLGLNEYEQKAYLSLVRYGVTGAFDLAKRSTVPYGRIYDVLYQLETKGFVKVILGKPKQFAPVEPKTVLDSALTKLKERYEEIEEQVKEDREELEQQFLLQEKDKKPSIWMVSGEGNVRETRRRELSEAQEELNVIVSPDVSTGDDPILERLGREAQDRGVKRRFIENPLTKSEWKKVRAKQEGGAEVRFSSHQGFTLSLVDRRLVRIEVRDSVYGRSSVFIENSNLAEALHGFFMYRWKKAHPKPIKEKP